MVEALRRLCPIETEYREEASFPLHLHLCLEVTEPKDYTVERERERERYTSALP